MNLSDFKEDTKLQNDGARIKIGGAIFQIRRLGTKASNKVLSEIKRAKLNPYEQLEEWEKQEIDKEITAEWLAKYGVAYWCGVKEHDESTEIEYSPQAAWTIFTDPEYHLSFNSLLVEKANDVSVFLRKNIKKDIDQIKKYIEFDITFPTREEKRAYANNARKLGADVQVPELNELQIDLLAALYDADRERAKDSFLKESDIKEQIKYIPLDLDLSLQAIKELDQFLISERAKKHDRQANKSSRR